MLKSWKDLIWGTICKSVNKRFNNLDENKKGYSFIYVYKSVIKVQNFLLLLNESEQDASTLSK